MFKLLVIFKKFSFYTSNHTKRKKNNTKQTLIIFKNVFKPFNISVNLFNFLNE